MNKLKKYLPVLTVSLGLLLLLLHTVGAVSSEPLDRVRFWDEVQNQELIPHYSEDEDKYYLYLPSYLEPDQVRLECLAGTRVELPNGDFPQSLGDLPAMRDIVLQISRGGVPKCYSFDILQCDNLPTLMIDIQPEGITRLNGDKDRQEGVFVRFLDESGQLIYQNSADMGGRGNYSWREGAKRPYNLSFSTPASLGPFENITTLCLVADYSDESRMRNALAFHVGREMEIPYASAYMQADVYVNGAYLGLYGLCTKQEYTKYIEEDQIQAVFEIASNKNGQYFVTKVNEHIINVMYGNIDTVENQVNQLEAALEERDWEACWTLLDLPSFTRKYVLDEFMGNMDMSYASQYFYIGADGLIRCMLPWDYDWSLGSAMTCFNREQVYGLMTRRSSWYWGTKLLPCKAFQEEVCQVLKAAYSDEFLTELQDYTVELNTAIDSSRACDYVRWKDEPSYGQGESGFETMSELIDFFNSYYPQRRDHLLAYFSNPGDFCLVAFGHRKSTYYFNYLIPKEDRLYDYLKDTEKLGGVRDGYEIIGWSTSDGQTLDQLDVITKSVTVYSEMVPLEKYWGQSDPEEPSVLRKLWEFRNEAVILCLFSLSALALFAALLRSAFRKERVRS